MLGSKDAQGHNIQGDLRVREHSGHTQLVNMGS